MDIIYSKCYNGVVMVGGFADVHINEPICSSWEYPCFSQVLPTSTDAKHVLSAVPHAICQRCTSTEEVPTLIAASLQT